MNAKPAVSIILPAYNASKYISETILSIISQTLSDWELIVVNDGSTDDTSAIVAKFSDPRIIVIEQDNKGVSYSRNVGLSSARGDYITFIDADDTFPEKSLELRVNFLKVNQDVHIVGGWVRIMNSSLTTLKHSKTPNYRGMFLPRLLALDDQIIASICYMIRRDSLRLERFDEEMTHCEDILFWISVASQNNIVYGAVNDYIYNYRVHDESATNIEIAWRNSHLELIKKIRKLRGINYRVTIVFRLKLLLILIKWHIKRKELKNIFELTEMVI